MSEAAEGRRARKISKTLAICIAGSLVAIAALFVPPKEVAQPEPAPAATADSTIEVTIANFAFTTTGALAPGQGILVTNADSVPHTLTAVDGSFDTGLLDPGQQARIVLPSGAGEFEYFCEVHPAMTGLFTVTS